MVGGGFAIEYLKKARGRCTASSTVNLPDAIVRGTVEHEVVSDIRDGSNEPAGDIVRRFAAEAASTRR